MLQSVAHLERHIKKVVKTQEKLSKKIPEKNWSLGWRCGTTAGPNVIRRKIAMETRFIDGGEFVDKATYIETRDTLSRARERIAELGRKVEYQEATIHTMSVDIGIDRAEIERLTRSNEQILAESDAYRQEYIRIGCENVKLLRHIAKLESENEKLRTPLGRDMELLAEDARMTARIAELEQKLRYTVNALDRADGALIKMRD